MSVFDAGVFEDYVAALGELFLVPLIVMHINLLLTLLGLERIDVWHREILEAREDVVLQLGRPV